MDGGRRCQDVLFFDIPWLRHRTLTRKPVSLTLKWHKY
jgi:hypothetical protein